MGPADGGFRWLHIGLARPAVEIAFFGAALIEIIEANDFKRLWCTCGVHCTRWNKPA